MIESALNSTLHDLFVPQGDEFKMRLSYDDDKHWYNFFVKIRDMILDIDEEAKEGESLSSHITIGDETVEEVLNDELIPRVEEGTEAYTYLYGLPAQT